MRELEQTIAASSRIETQSSLHFNFVDTVLKRKVTDMELRTYTPNLEVCAELGRCGLKKGMTFFQAFQHMLHCNVNSLYGISINYDPKESSNTRANGACGLFVLDAALQFSDLESPLKCWATFKPEKKDFKALCE